MKMELTQQEMCKAVECWFTEVMRRPVTVTKMTESRMNDYSTFAVDFLIPEEVKIVKGGDES